MKSVLVIGLGRFGTFIAQKFNELGDEVMAVDTDEEKVHDIMPYVVSAKIANATREETLEALDVASFDLCFVCIGQNFQSSLEITCLLKDLGAKKVISKASNKFHAKFLRRNGADEVVYPEKYSAEKFATKYSADNIFDFIELTEEAGIYEIPVVKEWVGKTIMQLAVRRKYDVNILAIKKAGKLNTMPGADYTFESDTHMIVLGNQEDVEKVIKLNDD